MALEEGSIPACSRTVIYTNRNGPDRGQKNLKAQILTDELFIEF